MSDGRVTKGSIPLSSGRVLVVVETDGVVQLQVRKSNGVIAWMEEMTPSDSRALGAILYHEPSRRAVCRDWIDGYRTASGRCPECGDLHEEPDAAEPAQ